MATPATYTFNKDIANYIEKCVKGGVSVKDMLAAMQDKFQLAPRNMSTLYRVYGSHMAEVRASLVAQIGDKVVQQALQGDFKSQELYLRSKGGWSPNATVNEVEQEGDPDEDEGAIDLLMAKLGKKRVDTTEEE